MRKKLLALVFGSVLVVVPHYAGAKVQTTPQLPASSISKPDLPPNDDNMPNTATGDERPDLDNADRMQDDDSDKVPHRRYMTRSSGQPTASPSDRENDE